MAFTNSPLVNHTRLCKDYSKGRYHKTYNPGGKIKKITIHHMAGNLTVEKCGELFATSPKEVSSNYGIGTDGRIGLYVKEENRPWTSSNPYNDYQAVTIEVANDKIGGDWHVSDKALEATINLCVDICKRNGIKKLNFTGDKSGNLTMHKYFIATTCPGPYLESKFSYIADEVNKRLNAKTESKTEDKKEDVKDKSALHKVQVGTFSQEKNAKAYIDKLRKAGFICIKEKVNDKWYVYAGSFAIEKNAEELIKKLKKAGFEAIIKTSTTKATTVKVELKVGDKVRMNKNATIYGSDDKFSDWIYGKILYVREIKGSRVVVSTMKTGNVTGAVDKKYLTKI